MIKVDHLLFALILFFSSSLVAQTVTSISSNVLEDGLAVDSEDNLYVSNFSGDSVYKITASGDISIFADGLITPNGLGFDSADNLYVSDWQANKIYKYDKNGSSLDTFLVSGNPSGMIKSFDNEDMIFTHYSSNKISRLNSADGTITTISEDPKLNGPVGLAYDENGNFFVGNYNNREVYQVMPDGSLTYIAQLPGSGQLPHLGFITYHDGLLWGTVLSANKIYTINPNGLDDFSVYAGSVLGSADGTLSEANFNGPNGIIFNQTGDVLYISEFGSKNLRIITGVLSSTAEISRQHLTVEVAPNPLEEDILNINATLPSNTKYQLGIYDVSGKEMMLFKGLSYGIKLQQTIDLSHLNSGIYFVKLTSENDSVSKKIIK